MPHFDNPADAIAAGLGITRLGPALAPTPTLPTPSSSDPGTAVERYDALPADQAVIIRQQTEVYIRTYGLKGDEAAAHRARVETLLAPFNPPPVQPTAPRPNAYAIEVARANLMPDNVAPGHIFGPSDYTLDLNHNMYARLSLEERSVVANDFKKAFSEVGISPLVAPGIAAFFFQHPADRLSDLERVERSTLWTNTAIRKWGAAEWSAKQARAKAYVEKSPLFKQALAAKNAFYLSSWWMVDTLNRAQDMQAQFAAHKR